MNRFNAGSATASPVKYVEEMARVKALPRYSTVKNFKGPDAELKAYQFGMWFGAILAKGARNPRPFLQRATLYADSHGLDTMATDLLLSRKAQGGLTNTGGGYLVPPEFSNDLIQLREEAGVFRRNTKVVPMMHEVITTPRRVSGVTVYYPAEGVAITESQKAWDAVTLTARKYSALAIYSSELSEDAIVSVGDDLAGEIAYAFGQSEDTNAFNGDGTSTYAGVTGIRQRLLDTYTVSGGVGLIVGTGNTYAELTLGDFNKVVGALPAYADPGAKWYASPFFWGGTMLRVTAATGGATAGRTFLGYPVELVSSLPKAEANSQVVCLFGDLKKAAKLGETREVRITISDQYKFVEDQFAIRGTERIDINVHDVGDSVNPGPVVGLITAAA